MVGAHESVDCRDEKRSDSGLGFALSTVGLMGSDRGDGNRGLIVQKAAKYCEVAVGASGQGLKRTELSSLPTADRLSKLSTATALTGCSDGTISADLIYLKGKPLAQRTQFREGFQ